METTPVNSPYTPKDHARTESHTRPGRSEQAAGAAQKPAGDGEAAFEISLSQAAQDAGAATGPGRSAESPAHQARAFLAERAAGGESAGGEKVPFGQIVSRVARGIDPAEALPAPVDTTAEGPAGSEGDATQAAAGGEADDAPFVEPDGVAQENLVAELLDDLDEAEDETL